MGWFCVPLNSSAFSELFETFIIALESYRAWGFSEEFCFHLFKAERERWKYVLLTGSFTSLDAALRMLSESLKFFLEEVKILRSFSCGSKAAVESHTIITDLLCQQGYKCQRQRLIHFILIRLHLSSELIGSCFLPHPKITQAL